MGSASYTDCFSQKQWTRLQQLRDTDSNTIEGKAISEILTIVIKLKFRWCTASKMKSCRNNYPSLTVDSVELFVSQLN